jgi:hypothetical protein
MKITTPSEFHLTYCTNIHPGESWQEVFANLEKYVLLLKAQISPTQPFGIGLRLADIATRELLQGNTLAKLQTWLEQQNLYVFTLNGFPYGNFHRRVVKDQVYAPDWTTQERFDYTLRLIEILAVLLPEGIEGSISTLPLSYKPWLINDKNAWELRFKQGSFHLALLAAKMAHIREKTGKLLHINLEPEPDGLIENTSEVISFFHEWLLPLGKTYLQAQIGISAELAETWLREHIRVCYDVCHFSVEYEEPESVFTQLQAAGIQIGKIQISAALKVLLSGQLEERSIITQRLYPFAESTYLHQVIERHPDGTLHHYQDLVTAIPNLNLTSAQEWRIHFHVPIFINDYQILSSTQDDIVKVLSLLRENPVCQHLEIETYTWDILPPEMKIDLVASIQREYDWVLRTMAI